jgi:acetylornithine/N-succinyldiaminopimelate aminotransferase
VTELESNVDGRQHWQSALMDNYGTPQLTLVRGEGSKVWDADGREYVDLVGGIAVNALGHAHPAVVEAVTEQIKRLGHTSNLYVNPVAVELAEALLDVAGLTGHGKVLFVNSGAEANEAALKISRLTGRTKVIAAEGAFHGRTMGALTLTGDVEALEAAVDTETAAVFLEPVLGEAGVIPAPDGYLQAAREITKATGTLLVLDEVQTGLGRLGTWFGYQQAGIVPDVITLAKGLGGGLPLGAVIGVGAAGDLLKPGQHGTTFGGNPVCCAAGLAVVKTIAADGLLDHVASLGKDIAAGVEALGHPLVAGVRGAGLLLGIALKQPVSAAVAQAVQDAGYLVNPVASDTIRLAPPLVLDGDQAEGFLAALPNALDSTTKDSD